VVTRIHVSGYICIYIISFVKSLKNADYTAEGFIIRELKAVLKMIY